MKKCWFLFTICFLLGFGAFAQPSEQANAKRIADLKKQLDDLEQTLKKEEAVETKNTSDKDLSEIKSLLMQLVEQNETQKQKNVTNNTNPNSEVIVLYIEEIDKIKKEMAALRAEMQYMQMEIEQLRKATDANKRALATAAAPGSAYSGKKADQSLVDALNENLQALRQDISAIREQSVATNEKLEKLVEGGNVSGLNTKVNELAKETELIKSKVESFESKSKYLVLERTVESLSKQGTLNKSDLPAGYYIIIDSERSYQNILRKQKEHRANGYEATIIQNKLQTWYHIYSERVESKEAAGKAVSETRRKGIRDAWYIAN